MSMLRRAREASGMTQAELAARAGMSRQMVGAIESGRHLPRVDAAISLARALCVELDALFPSPSQAVDAVTGRPLPSRSLVRIGWVGDRVVTAPAGTGSDGWDVADGVVEDGSAVPFDRRPPGLVVAGCEPGLTVIERLLRERGMGAVAASASSAAARSALSAGRLHAAVVHGAPGARYPVPESPNIVRIRLASWQVGLAAPIDASQDWWREALAGVVPVVQREQGAGVQQAFLDASETERDIPGPTVGSHLAAARLSLATGLAAVTIEPAALAVGARFHPLEAHEAQLWIADHWIDDRVVTEALAIVGEKRFTERLAGIGGYDLSRSGSRAA